MPKPIVERVTDGELTTEELKTLRLNVISKGGNDNLIAAIDAQLVRLSHSRRGRKNGADYTVAERRGGHYSVMASALDERGQLRDPKLLPVAEAFGGHPSVEDVAILKTQIRFYYKGRHMICGYAAKGGYWVVVLNDTKVSDSTIEAWSEIGKIIRGKYFSNNSVGVEFADLTDVSRVLSATRFVSAG
jgi:hypothetical protein